MVQRILSSETVLLQPKRNDPRQVVQGGDNNPLWLCRRTLQILHLSILTTYTAGNLYTTATGSNHS